jgi:hypothetical protein
MNSRKKNTKNQTNSQKISAKRNQKRKVLINDHVDNSLPVPSQNRQLQNPLQKKDHKIPNNNDIQEQTTSKTQSQIRLVNF